MRPHRASFVLVAALLGCATEAPPQAPVARPIHPTERIAVAPQRARPAAEGEDASEALVQETLVKVSHLRGLPIRHPVLSRTLPREEVVTRIKKHVDEEIPPDVVAAEGEILIGLGLLPADYDYLAGTLALLEGQIAGFYEPTDKTMYLVDDLGEEEAEETLAHELVHALQDQSYDIGRFLKFELGQSDRIGAEHALLEGDATSAMFDYALAGRGGTALDMDPSRLRTILLAGALIGNKGMTTPPVLVASLVAPYSDGFAFVDDRRRAGGWKAVDAAYAAMPTTTEQLLHPDKYAAHEPALAVPRIAVDALGKGFAVRLDDDMGEESLRIALQSWSTQDLGAAAAAGWGGDRVVLAERKDAAVPSKTTLAVAYHVRFDAPKDADRAQALLKTKLAQNAPAKAAQACVERKDLGPLAFRRSGADLVIVGGPYARDGKQIAPAGSCSDADRWARAILKAL